MTDKLNSPEINKATDTPWRADTFAIYNANNEHVAHTGGCGRSN